jgi:predicted acyltransferase
MYVMSWLTKPWIEKTIKTHFGATIFDGTYGPIIESVTLVVALWIICYWMHRRGIYLRI